jgi:hypothetical protein
VRLSQVDQELDQRLPVPERLSQLRGLRQRGLHFQRYSLLEELQTHLLDSRESRVHGCQPLLPTVQHVPHCPAEQARLTDCLVDLGIHQSLQLAQKHAGLPSQILQQSIHLLQ